MWAGHVVVVKKQGALTTKFLEFPSYCFSETPSGKIKFHTNTVLGRRLLKNFALQFGIYCTTEYVSTE